MPDAAGSGPSDSRRIPQRAGCRVIVDNDFAGDPDGLVALLHQALAPRARTVLVTSSGLNPALTPPDLAGRGAAAGAELATECLRRAGLPVPVVAGAEPGDREPSGAARAIVAEAMRDDPLPLFLTCGGPLTNVAAALSLEPAIASRLTLVWIGGDGYPGGGWEYNLATDADAARLVIEETAVPLWQVPQPAYRQVQWSIAEMEADLRPISPLAEWLYAQFTSPPDFVELGGAWPMGDSPLVLLTSLTIESSRFRDRTARRILSDCRQGERIPGRTIRVFEAVDARLILGDFLARLRLHASGQVG